jgi:hypothetical protein
MNTPINFEIAKLLKEKGFDIPYPHLELFNPTIAEVVMWLYDKYNYSIEHSMNIPQSGEQDGCYVFNGIVKGAENYKLVIHYSSENLSSIKKAYEVAIEYTLKNLL